jgi:isoleucyl-tRNA synthetase
LSQLIEAYRKIRNTCRFLLSNLYDFDPAVHTVPYDRLPELDRWALMRLGELIPRVTNAYEEFEFHSIFHALNNFCSVDMSAIYLDILKDRLYTFHKDSPLRRSSQTVLLEIVVALTKLMAPVLSFTAEEIWRMLPKSATVDLPSVHLSAIPKADSRWANTTLAVQWEQLLEVRESVQGELEKARREKVIGSSLEAKVSLQANPDKFELLKVYEATLAALFIVSQVELEKVSHLPHHPNWQVKAVAKAPAQKCERCWNYREAVGMDKEHPTLCDRCLEAIR